MQFNRNELGKKAKELGFAQNSFEKVCRLIDVLSFLEMDTLLADSLALKGGTAINLTVFDLPRLSVDIDLDLAENLTREQMQEKRKRISDRLKEYMVSNGYSQNTKSRSHYALDAFVFTYQNAAKVSDNLKIDINYLDRCHILPLAHRWIELPWLENRTSVLCLDPMEIFASKIVALMNRSAPRDLYDVCNMIQSKSICPGNQDLLRKCVVFYSAIASDQVTEQFSFSKTTEINQTRIKTELFPVLRKGERFDVNDALSGCLPFLHSLMELTPKEQMFLYEFSEKRYHPELLFDEKDILDRIQMHPMAVWKTSRTKIQDNDLIR